MTDGVKRVEPERARGGEWVRIGDEEYRIPPLGFRAIIELQEDVESLASMGKQPSLDQMRVVAKIAHSAMARNYPSLSVDEVLDMLDLDNYQGILSSVLNIGGFKKQEGDGDGPGEVRAAPTGPPSTRPSSTRSAGRGSTSTKR